MKFQWQEKERLVVDGLLSIKKHPTEDLYICNYTKRAQYENIWTDELKACRGLILDGQDNIIARPFPKFFNYGEHIDNGWPIPSGNYKVFEKLDGCFGALFWVGETPFIASRGSFESFASDAGNEILKTLNLKKSDFSPNTTQIFEIIHPDTKIVVDYKGKKALIHLATIDNETGLDIHIDLPPNIERAKKYSRLTLEEIVNNKDIQEPNREGFVLLYDSGERIKFKFDDYLRLHRVICGLTPRRIWGILSKNEMSVKELLINTPEEFRNWVEDIIFDLKTSFVALKEMVQVGVWKNDWDVHWETNRAKVAQEIMLRYPFHSGFYFSYLRKDWGSLDKAIWDKLYPKATKGFWGSGMDL